MHIYIHDSINDIKNHIVAKFGFIINANTVKTILYCVLLTFNINSVVDITFPYRILSLTAILSRVWRHDVAKDELWSLVHLCEGTICINPEPGVLCCWVGLTAAAQSHRTALLYFTRGTHGHWGGIWSVCYEHKISRIETQRKIWKHICSKIQMAMQFAICNSISNYVMQLTMHYAIS